MFYPLTAFGAPEVTELKFAVNFLTDEDKEVLKSRASALPQLIIEETNGGLLIDFSQCNRDESVNEMLANLCRHLFVTVESVIDQQLDACNLHIQFVNESFTEQELKEKFKKFGVVCVRIGRNESFVRFCDAQSAAAAIEEHNKKYKLTAPCKLANRTTNTVLYNKTRKVAMNQLEEIRKYLDMPNASQIVPGQCSLNPLGQIPQYGPGPHQLPINYLYHHFTAPVMLQHVPGSQHFT